jgi:hypothetical protein
VGTVTTGIASMVPVTGASTTYPSLPDTPKKATPTVAPGSSTTVPVTCAVTTSPSPPDPTTKSHPTQLEQPQGKIRVRRMRDEALRRYQDFQEDGRIEVQTIDTFQGRKDGPNGSSANGCVVISAMMVTHHLAHPALPNENIKAVIDDHCVEHIGVIRALEGSTAGAFLDPFDVHEHLESQGMLQEADGIIQGNVLDEEDMRRFLQMLREKRKAGGTFFFRDHSISILKSSSEDGTTFYDVVNSLDSREESSCTTRSCCTDEQALKVLLEWYTTKEFTPAKCTYMDKNAWALDSTDPRTFQGSVWGVLDE